MKDPKTIAKLHLQITSCTRCPRLVEWRESIAKEKVARFRDWEYWGKPIPGFGDTKARLLIVGLAPAAHGGNRTGRIFTGDRSGDWLFKALHKFGFASQPESISKRDGQRLKDCYITAAVRCAPPQNKPTLQEIHDCRPYLLRELQLLNNVKVVIGLGRIACDAVLQSFHALGLAEKKRLDFGHGNVISLNKDQTLITSFHPSQQNTFTKRLTEPMFDGVFKKAKGILQ
jgi:uracil-DNA glycosylase family 4